MSKSDAEFHLPLSVHFILATAGHLWTQIGPDTAPLRGCFKPLYILYSRCHPLHTQTNFHFLCKNTELPHTFDSIQVSWYGFSG